MNRMSGERLVGMEVRIMYRPNWHYGRWGTIVKYEGKFYHVALREDHRIVVPMTRSEFWVIRGQR